MPRTLYLLRHGQTVYNAEQRLQGQCNSALTALGEQQAQAMGRTLRGLLPQPQQWALYASPLGRAQQTAQLVCDQLALPHSHIRSDARLQELGLGDWEGQRIPDIRAICPQLAAGAPDWYTHAPNAEPFASIRARLHHWLHDTTLPDNLIVVAHGLSGAVLRAIYAQLDYPALWRQEIPQDAFFRLHGGSIERIQCGERVA